MKVTDYAPRAAPFDSHLMKLSVHPLIGVEVGVDVGAHAQAMLTYCRIGHITLVDPWPNPYCRGYCEGRLMAMGFGPRFTIEVGESLKSATRHYDGSLDFVYIDQEHDGPSVSADLVAWWPKLKPGGVMGYRNYTTTSTPLSRAVDGFVMLYCIPGKIIEAGEIVLRKP